MEPKIHILMREYNSEEYIMLFLFGKIAKTEQKTASLSFWYKTFFFLLFSILSFLFLKFNEINNFMNQKYYTKIQTIDKILIYAN